MATHKPTPILHVDGTVAITMLADSIKELKTDMNRQFDQIREGQKFLHQKFEAHEKADEVQFGEIKIVAAEAKGEAKAQADAVQKSNNRWLLGVTALGGSPWILELGKWLFHR